MTSHEILKSKLLKATPTRLTLLDALRNAKTPLTAEELHRITQKGDLVTVYRGLHSFLNARLVREVFLKDSPARYEFADSHHHHHLVCTGCGVIDELPNCDVQDLERLALKSSRRFACIAEHSLEFFGSCKTCARAV